MWVSRPAALLLVFGAARVPAPTGQVTALFPGRGFSEVTAIARVLRGLFSCVPQGLRSPPAPFHSPLPPY